MEVIVESGHITYIIDRGETGLIAKCARLTDETIKELVLPDSICYQETYIPVKIISDTAFYGCKLVSIRLNGIIDSIGSFSFGNCQSLKKIEGLENVQYIGEGAFWNCFRLNSFSLPPKLTNIEPYTFYSCINLTNIIIPEGVESIGEDAFAHCGLKSVIIPSSVIRIGSSNRNSDVFFGCVQLRRIAVNKRNKTFDSRHDCNAIIETKENKLISGCYTTKIPSSIETIGTSAFGYRVKLTKIKIPSKVQNIEYGSFAYCRGLNKIRVSRLNKKYDSRNNCNAIIQTDFGWLHTACSATTIPDDVHTIGPKAYQGSINMGLFVIPEHITEIGRSAFFDCEDLRTIVFPDSLSYIGSKAFYNCTSLSAITIPDNVKKIEEETFKNCLSLTSVTMPSTLSEISDNAFENCVNYDIREIP